MEDIRKAAGCSSFPAFEKVVDEKAKIRNKPYAMSELIEFLHNYKWVIASSLVALCLLLVALRYLSKQPVAIRVARQLRTQIRALLASAASTFWYATCCAYIVWWSISLPVRRALTGSAIFILGVSSLFFLFESISTFFHHEILKQALPLLVQIAIVLLAGAMVFHRVEEWRKQKQKWDLSFALRFLLPEIRRFKEEVANCPDKKEKFLELCEKIMSAFSAIFKESIEVKLNLMIAGKDEKLTIRCTHPKAALADYSSEPLQVGRGGAGVACASKLLVYIPAVRYRHGISITLQGSLTNTNRLVMRRSYDFLDLVYEISDLEPFRSILCVPVRMNPECRAVLNLDCMKQNPFREFDFDLADVAGGLIGLAIDSVGLDALQ